MSTSHTPIQICVLGTGCRKCRKTLANARTAVTQLRLQADFSLVKDIREISRHVAFPPGVLINGKLVAEGYVVPVDLFVEWLSPLKSPGP